MEGIQRTVCCPFYTQRIIIDNSNNNKLYEMLIEAIADRLVCVDQPHRRVVYGFQVRRRRYIPLCIILTPCLRTWFRRLGDVNESGGHSHIISLFFSRLSSRLQAHSYVKLANAKAYLSHQATSHKQMPALPSPQDEPQFTNHKCSTPSSCSECPTQSPHQSTTTLTSPPLPSPDSQNPQKTA